MTKTLVAINTMLIEEGPPHALSVAITASTTRAEYKATIIHKGEFVSSTLTAQKDTHGYHYSSTPYGKKVGKTKDILWGFAPRLANNLSEATGYDRDMLMNAIRRMCHPDYQIEVEAYPASSPFSDGYEHFSKIEAELSEASFQLPGVNHPVICPQEDCDDADYMDPTELRIIIMHLNDNHKWDRNKIADWLDKLYAEGVDLAFKDIPDGD